MASGGRRTQRSPTSCRGDAAGGHHLCAGCDRGASSGACGWQHPLRRVRRRDQPRPQSSDGVVHRSMRFSAQYIDSWNIAGGDPPAAAAISWLRTPGGAAAARIGFAYQNYIDADLTGWGSRVLRLDYARFARIKRRFDPANVFRFPQKHRPRAALSSLSTIPGMPVWILAAGLGWRSPSCSFLWLLLRRARAAATATDRLVADARNAFARRPLRRPSAPEEIRRVLARERAEPSVLGAEGAAPLGGRRIEFAERERRSGEGLADELAPPRGASRSGSARHRGPRSGAAPSRSTAGASRPRYNRHLPTSIRDSRRRLRAGSTAPTSSGRPLSASARISSARQGRPSPRRSTS